MLEKLFFTFLISISPFGEARAGIPYAILNDVYIVWAFFIGLGANLLVFPILMWLIDTFSAKFWPNKTYRKGVVKISKRAKKSVGKNFQKYGFWGLMIFVMIPLPGTGAYIGTIAAYVLKIERKRAFIATSIGVLISCIVMAAGAYYGNIGLDLI